MPKFKMVFVLFIMLLFFAPRISYAGSFRDKSSGTPGRWYAGATPDSVSAPKFPILFVHGFNRSSETWYENNDMYRTAYENGYETAFIDLHPDKNMWDNGALLAEKLKEMYEYFGEKVVVVAHSKGGIDTQTALVHYGAIPYIERMITMATPYHGAQLADLAYSSWAGWLAGILGGKNDATSSLQTGYMSYFRSRTDNQPSVYETPIYTMAGTKWGRFGSSLYWGGLYLRAFGSNDGAVTVKSSRIEYAPEIKVGDWNHSTIKQGSATFHEFESYLREDIPSFAQAQAANEKSIEPEEMEASHYVSGGEYTGTTEEKIHVEKGVQVLTIHWSSDQAATNLTLVSPDQTTYTSFATEQDETTYFQGAYHHSLIIENPKAGKWTLQANSAQKEHYLLNTSFESPLNQLISTSLSEEDMKVNINDEKLNLSTNMTIEFYKNGKLEQGTVKASKKHEDTFKLPNLGEGIYNMTIDIHGTYDKEPFQRTMIKSVYVDDQGQLYYE
ncbi:esterase/lipase family protein [Halobacillus mangrovi]|uniref:esterase/lipase family protein n=1 Tax=Halobacillus mangrovi TaxID=402384 RepID=UPI003D95E956